MTKEPSDPGAEGAQDHDDLELDTQTERAFTGSSGRRHVQERAWRIESGARELLGERFGEIRIDHDGTLVVTIIDMTPDDIKAIGRMAHEAGISGWTRARGADPAALDAWEQVRHELIRLRETRTGAVTFFPMPDPGYRHPPFHIRLAAYATDVAASLHQRFGDFIALHVGALDYPAASETDRKPRQRDEPTSPVIDPAEIRTELDGPLSIPSGHTATHGLNITNISSGELSVNTNGHLTAEVIDPQSGSVVGGYSGMQNLPLITFPIPPGTTVRIPILVGTASFHHYLGYAVPAGPWYLRTALELNDGRTLNTPTLPFIITE